MTIRSKAGTTDSGRPTFSSNEKIEGWGRARAEGMQRTTSGAVESMDRGPSRPLLDIALDVHVQDQDPAIEGGLDHLKTETETVKILESVRRARQCRHSARTGVSSSAADIAPTIPVGTRPSRYTYFRSPASPDVRSPSFISGAQRESHVEGINPSAMHIIGIVYQNCPSNVLVLRCEPLLAEPICSL